MAGDGFYGAGVGADTGPSAERAESDSAALELDSSFLANLRDAKQLIDRKERFDEHSECESAKSILRPIAVQLLDFSKL